tara:strand:- start:909 stop:1172 length:264 start_codon:yes stop_codon:yes gene_type:complete
MSRFIDQHELETIQQIVEEHLRKLGMNLNEEIWVDSKRAMEILGVRQTQLYLIRTDPKNKIVFSQANKKNLMYKVESLYSYLNRHIK